MQRKSKGNMKNVRVPCGSSKSEIKINCFSKFLQAFTVRGEKTAKVKVLLSF